MINFNDEIMIMIRWLVIRRLHSERDPTGFFGIPPPKFFRCGCDPISLFIFIIYYQLSTDGQICRKMFFWKCRPNLASVLFAASVPSCAYFYFRFSIWGFCTKIGMLLLPGKCQHFQMPNFSRGPQADIFIEFSIL